MGRKGPERPPETPEPAPAGQRTRPDATAGFPRGLGDPYRPAATAAWPSGEEIAALAADSAVHALEVWTPGCGAFLLGHDHRGAYYGVRDDRHILTIAGSRAGKGVSLIVPNLLFWPGSVIAIDPKGELATITASRRSATGSQWAVPMTPGEGKVYALDPFQRVAGDAKQFAQAAFNPLADLDADTDRGLDLAWQIADALIIQSDGDGAHWTQSARSFLRGLILYVAATEEPDSKNLITVRRLLTQNRKAFTDMLAVMSAMGDIGGGVIARTADALKNKPAVERFSVVSTCETHTAFLEGESMRRVLSGSSFRLEDLKSERITVYLCLPATRLATHGRWLRMIVSLAVEAMERTGPLEEGRPAVLFCLDEFAALGHMESVEKAAGQIAGFGVKLWPIVQDLTQLQRDYKAAWETFMGNAGLLTFFGNTDVTTAEHIARRLGETEVIRTVTNASEGWQQTEGTNRPNLLGALTGVGGLTVSTGTTKAGGVNKAEQMMRAPLMHPHEIMQAFARESGKLLAVIPHPRLPPFALYRCAYHGEEDDALFGGLFDPAPGQKPPRTSAARRRERG